MINKLYKALKNEAVVGCACAYYCCLPMYSKGLFIK